MRTWRIKNLSFLLSVLMLATVAVAASAVHVIFKIVFKIIEVFV
jgi:hypothetical protein